MARIPSVGGNWKMNTTRADAAELAAAVAGAGGAGCDVTVFPPFTLLTLVAEALADTDVRVGGQDVYFEPEGAFTGEISAGMLLDAGATAVLIGHSERRHVIGEDDGLIARKLNAALEAGLAATLCVGETLEQREAGRTEAVNLGQLDAGLDAVPPAAFERLTIAYEPVWAIGTGRTASPADAQAVHAAIRTRLAERYDEGLAQAIRLQYGGSVKPANAAELFAQADIDGGLIGGASLEAESFTAIVNAARQSG
ncbi:MAG: triose-phosphate isomerase [Planctomycetota bacterium]|jgi:triosephosphate isomerase